MQNVSLKPLLLNLIEGMITTPSRLRVSEYAGSDRVILGIECKPEDYSFLIGRSAQNIKAIQTIFKHVARHRGLSRINVSVKDPQTYATPNIPPHISSQWQDDARLGDALVNLLTECGYPNSTVVPGSAGNITTLHIFTGKPMDNDLLEAIVTLFRAIGKMRGRIVEIDTKG